MCHLVLMGTPRSILLIASVLALCTGNTESDTQEVCYGGLMKCYKTFVRDASLHVTRSEICQDVGMFVACILELDCDITEKIKGQAFDTVEKILAKKGLKCEEISNLKETYVKGEEETKPGSTIQARSRLFTVPNPEVSKSSNGEREADGSHNHWVKSSMEHRGTPKETERGLLSEPQSSRRSRRLPRPVSWSNWRSVKNVAGSFSFFSFRTATATATIIIVLNLLFVDLIC